MLPVPGAASWFLWDQSNPNLFVNSCWVGEEDRYAIFVWHIEKGHAKLLRVINAYQGSFSLDQGYRLFFFTKNHAKSYNILTEQTFQIPDSSSESLLDGSVSPNGRYLLTYTVPNERTQYSIFDLQEGKLVRAIHGPQRIQWNNESSKIAAWFKKPVRESRQQPGGIIRVIDVSTGETENEFIPERFSLNKSVAAFSPDFSAFASSTNDGNVVLTDLNTDRKTKLKVSETSQLNGQATIGWADNRTLRIRCMPRQIRTTDDSDLNRNAVTYEFKRASGIKGELERLGPEKSPASKNHFARKGIDLVNTRLLEDESLGLVVKVSRADEEKSDSFFVVRADDAGSSALHRFTCSSDVERLLKDLSSQPSLSPNGNFAFTIKNESNNRVTGRKIGEILCFRTSNPEGAVSIGRFEWIRSIGWTKDEKYAMLTGREHSSRGTQDCGIIIDLEKMKVINVAGTSNWSDSVYDFIPYRTGFLIGVAHSPMVRPMRDSGMNQTQYNHRLVLFDPDSPQMSKQIELEEHLRSKIASTSIRRTKDGRTILQVYKKTATAPESEDKKVLFKVTANFELIRMSPKSGEPAYDSVKTWEFEKDVINPAIREKIGRINSVTRNSFDSSQYCVYGTNRILFYNARNNSVEHVFRGYSNTVRALPVQGGWMLSSPDSISTFDFSGQLVNRRFLYVDDETGEPKLTGWIKNNGDGFEALRQKHPRKNFPKVVFDGEIYRVE